ncbi:MAG: hypothetical protein KGY51_02135 [Psychroflexus sp.]|nr:hypothetical protein [Psychroflexus sp.]
MKKLRLGVSVVAIVLIAIELYLIDYKNLSLADNTNHYLVIFAMICLILSMVFSQRHDDRLKK